MPHKANLCYISSWIHRPLHVYSLVGGLITGSSGCRGRGVLFGCSSNEVANPFVTSVLPLTPPPGSLGLVGWLAASILICIGQALAEPLRGQLYLVLLSKHFLAPAIVSVWVSCLQMGWIPRWGSLDGLSFSLCSTLCPCISFI